MGVANKTFQVDALLSEHTRKVYLKPGTSFLRRSSHNALQRLEFPYQQNRVVVLGEVRIEVSKLSI